MKRSCESCEFFVRSIGSSKRKHERFPEIGGHCRRYPPTINIYEHPNEGIQWDQSHPYMSEESWCGEWKTRMSALKARHQMHDFRPESKN